MNSSRRWPNTPARPHVPVCASETLGSRWPYKEMLDRDAIGVVMVDLCWTGGLTEGRKIASLAETYHKPFAPHDCIGPVGFCRGGSHVVQPTQYADPGICARVLFRLVQGTGHRGPGHSRRLRPSDGGARGWARTFGLRCSSVPTSLCAGARREGARTLRSLRQIRVDNRLLRRPWPGDRARPCRGRGRRRQRTRRGEAAAAAQPLIAAGHRISTRAFDVTDEAAVQRRVRWVRRRGRRIDICSTTPAFNSQADGRSEHRRVAASDGNKPHQRLSGRSGGGAAHDRAGRQDRQHRLADQRGGPGDGRALYGRQRRHQDADASMAAEWASPTSRPTPSARLHPDRNEPGSGRRPKFDAWVRGRTPSGRWGSRTTWSAPRRSWLRPLRLTSTVRSSTSTAAMLAVM